MDIVILAAGKGTRLRPLTDRMPKPLVPVAGRGTLLRLLDQLPACVDRILIVVSYLSDQIRKTIGTQWKGIPVFYVEQSLFDGTGGALRAAKSRISGERFFVVNGDDLYAREDLERLCKIERGLLIFERITRAETDVWQVDEKKRLIALARVSAGNRANINCGAYVLGNEWFLTDSVLSPGKSTEWSIPHAIPQLLHRHDYRAVEATVWFPCGTQEEIIEAESCHKVQDNV